MSSFHRRFTENHKGVTITNEYFSGHKHVIKPTLIRSILGIVSCNKKVAYYYIGIASGSDYLEGLKRRIDDKKIAFGVTRMYLLYQTSSAAYIRDLERELIDDFWDFNVGIRMFNDASGGGGRNSSGPNFYLYLAVSNIADWRRIARSKPGHSG